MFRLENGDFTPLGTCQVFGIDDATLAALAAGMSEGAAGTAAGTSVAVPTAAEAGALGGAAGTTAGGWGPALAASGQAAGGGAMAAPGLMGAGAGKGQMGALMSPVTDAMKPITGLMKPPAAPMPAPQAGNKSMPIDPQFDWAGAQDKAERFIKLSKSVQDFTGAMRHPLGAGPLDDKGDGKQKLSQLAPQVAPPPPAAQPAAPISLPNTTLVPPFNPGGGEFMGAGASGSYPPGPGPRPVRGADRWIGGPGAPWWEQGH